MVEIGIWLTKYVTIPILALLLVAWVVGRGRPWAKYKCLYCDHTFRGSQLKWDGRMCPKCGKAMVRK